jgi:hypothetical protein
VRADRARAFHEEALAEQAAARSHWSDPSTAGSGRSAVILHTGKPCRMRPPDASRLNR